MTFRVTFTSKAKREFNETAIWWAEHRSVEQAAQWLDGLEAAVLALAEDPERHALAREDEHFSFSLHELLFGIGPKPTHRVLYRIREDEVIIYGVRHVARGDVRPEDI